LKKDSRAAEGIAFGMPGFFLDRMQRNADVTMLKMKGGMHYV
jgi:hypothetical protein